MNPIRLSQMFRFCSALALALTLALSLVLTLPPRAARAATIIVNTATDESDGSCSDGDCSLRDAIALAAGGDTITFAGDYTIYLDSQLDVDKTLTIDGSGHAVTVSGDSGGDGTPNTRVFFIGSSGVVTLTHLSIVDGIADKGGGIYVYSLGRLFVRNCFLAGNATSDYPNTGGGGILNEGEATVINSTLAGNSGGGYGGGIYSQGPLTVTNSTLVGNSSSYRGGGIYISHDLLRLRNTLIADNSGGDCGLGSVGAGVAENDHNLIKGAGAFACNLINGEGGSLIGVDPLLGALGDYGGNTQTFALLPGSPALDAGNDAACPSVDQRDSSRPQGAHCDIGAFESHGFTLSITGGNDQSAPIHTLFPQPLSLTVVAGMGEPVDGGQVILTGPDSGAGISPSVYTVTINGGVAAQAVRANATAGSYSVSADARGRIGSAAGFALTNSVAVTHTLTIATVGDGSGVVTPTVGAHTYVSGTLVALGATPHPGSVFSGWSGAPGCAAGQVTLDADKVCTATFVLEGEQYFIYLPLVARN